jgi:hypothetical protein
MVRSLTGCLSLRVVWLAFGMRPEPRTGTWLKRFARLKEALPFLVCHQQQRERKRPMDEMVIIGKDRVTSGMDAARRL